MTLLLLLTAALSASHPAIPASIRGEWDLVGHCKVPADGSDSRVIVRATEVVFVETVFTPRRVLVGAVRNWTARGEFNVEGEVSRGRLNLRLSRDGNSLAYTNWDKRVVTLVRCRR